MFYLIRHTNYKFIKRINSRIDEYIKYYISNRDNYSVNSLENDKLN